MPRFWVISLATALFAGAMLARYIVGRAGLRQRIRPQIVVIVAWISAGLSAIAVVVSMINGTSNIGWTTTILVVAAAVALLLHRRMQTATNTPPHGDGTHNDE